MKIMVDDRPFSAAEDVFSWLSGFINFERLPKTGAFRLDRMKLLAQEAGHPETSAPVIHIAGSKGKGSLAVMLSSILGEAGYRSACYTSPHLLDYRERVSLGNEFFPDTLYCRAGEELRRLVHRVRDKKLLDGPEGSRGEPTFFELLTLYFFLCARSARASVMVLETGMGGRLDATNIVKPEISVISSIELEHTEYLGTTLAAIAGEKGGIIKEGRPLALAPQEDRILELFTTICAEKNSPLIYLPREARIDHITVTKSGTSFTLALGDMSGTLQVPLIGRIQAQNAALAVLAIKTAFPGIDAAAIAGGLKKARLPGRFECINSEPPLVIDGAHTAQSAALAAESFTALYGNGGILIFGSVAGKNAAAMAKILAPRFSHIIITTPGTFKASDPQALYELYRSRPPGNQSQEIELIPDTGKAVERALALGKEKKLPILGTGSFYLAGAIKGILI
jgi:dihydrofolate synthase/folylpolyglutamate synthase